jgi:hypothetical protein
VNGVCTTTCPAGWQTCVAGCVNVAADTANCGGCGNECGPGQACRGGSCVAGQ